MTDEAWAVDYASASAAATETETAIGEVGGVKTDIETAFDAAIAALPTSFTTARVRLEVLRSGHARDVTTVSDYATGCVASLRECLNAYENATAEMVVAQYQLEQNLQFEHGTIFSQTENEINESIDDRTGDFTDGLPQSGEGTSVEGEYEATVNRDGSGSSSTGETTVTENGVTTTIEESTTEERRGGTTTTTSSTTVTTGPTAR